MSDTLFITLFVGSFVGLTAAIVFGALWFNNAQCHARWEPTRKAEWGIVQGCLVESRGVMVPEDRIWFERND